MDLGHGQLGPRVLHAGLLVGVLGRAHDLGEARVVVLRAHRALARPGGEGQALDVDRLVGVAVGVLGPDDDGRRRPVRHAGAVEDAEGAGHQRRGADGLLGDLLAELGPGVAGAVEVVLPGDAGHDVLELGVVDAVLPGVGRGQQREHGGSGHGRRGAVAAVEVDDEAGVAGVLQLLHTGGHDHVIRSGGDCVTSVPERLGAGGAEVLHPGDRLVVELERAGQREARQARRHRPEPEGVDVGQGDPRGGRRLLHRFDEEVVDALVPVLAEGGAAHPDDGDLVPDSVAGHQADTSIPVVGDAMGLAFQK